MKPTRTRVGVGHLLTAAVFVMVLPAGAHAQSRDGSSRAMVRQAMEDYAAGDSDGALSRLRLTLHGCERNRCSPGVAAVVHVAIGTVLIDGHSDNAGGEQEFTTALGAGPECSSRLCTRDPGGEPGVPACAGRSRAVEALARVRSRPRLRTRLPDKTTSGRRQFVAATRPMRRPLGKSKQNPRAIPELRRPRTSSHPRTRSRPTLAADSQQPCCSAACPNTRSTASGT